MEDIGAHPEYKILENRIYLSDGRMRFCTPKVELRNSSMSDLQYARCSGNLRIKRTTFFVKRYFYWPILEKDVTDYVRTCEKCQRGKQ